MIKNNEAINLFFQIFPNLKNQQYKIRQLNSGFTNLLFLIKIGQKKYLIRIGKNNQIINRQNEYNVIKTLNENDYYYFDIQTGNFIKKWINGNCLRRYQINKKMIVLINQTIQDLHSKEIKYEIQHHSNYFFEKFNKNKLSHKYAELYNGISEQQKTHKLVLSHNDLSLRNLIYHQHQLTLIDFEYATVNSYYWDYANFIREANLKTKYVKYWTTINPELDYLTLIKYLYLTIYYAIQWTYTQNETKRILKYRSKATKQLEKWYQFLTNKGKDEQK